MKKRNKSYEVNVRVVVETSVQVTAENYEQALSKARELNVKDIVDFDTDYNDGSIAITGIWNFTEEPK